MARSSVKKDLFMYFPAKILEGLMGIYAISIYTNHLNPKDYGEFWLIQPLLLLTYTLCSSFVYHASFRFATDKNYENDTFISTILTLLGLTQIFAYGVLSLIFLLGDFSVDLGLMCLFFFGFSTNAVLSGLLVSRKMSTQAVVFSLIAWPLKLLGMLLIWHLGIKNFYSILGGNFFSDLVLILGAIYVLKIRYKLKSFDPLYGKQFITYGFPLIGLSLIMLTLSISDRYIIQYFYSPEEVGIYTANYYIASSTFSIILIGLMRALYPSILEAFNSGDMIRSSHLLKSSIKIYLVVAVPSAFGMLLIESRLSEKLLHSSYTNGHHVIGIVAFGMLFLGLAEYASKPLELLKRTKTILKISIGSAIINVGCNIIFVPLFGYKIAAYTTLLCYLLQCLFMIRGTYDLMDYFPSRNLIFAVVSSSLVMFIFGKMILPLRDETWWLVTTIFSCILVYFGGIYISKQYKLEIHHLLSIIRSN